MRCLRHAVLVNKWLISIILEVTLYMMKCFRDTEFGLGVLHFENAKNIALLRIFCRNVFEMVVSVVINCTYSKKLTVSPLVQKTRLGEGSR